ncbi:glycosyl hydrolase [Jejuia pallidilutea]|uniref:Putative glycosyslhydrolase n=1 Tax=Jejuia pallidilutea TaxID=504487 RepID=A0A090W1R8_9FLAO|nr:glycosyl hydrolase [Jejuia pallidilutea]GAL67237.1 putative glycosyslhydrolase [Jejuia pallidilutea]GAL70876.1 putative glycosyslhydrolase [Jejuia pallidilutea]GAL89773.1 putative glycosyslhydrolase [Jejuia pallidilutea]
MFLKRNTQVLILFSIILLAMGSCNDSKNYDIIKSGFVKPTEENTIWCYWYWINDDISKDGITKDLEAMKKAGIGGALIGNINPAHKDGKVPMLSEDWWSHMVHAVVEGKRIGVDIGIFNCPGWSQSGGPWVDYTKAMRYLTYSETKVEGGKIVTLPLKKPKEKFQDTHTFAFKSSGTEKRNTQFIPTKIVANWNDVDVSVLSDGVKEADTSFEPKKGETLEISFSLAESITARSITIIPSRAFKCNMSLIAVVDGKEKLVKEFHFDRFRITPNVASIETGDFATILPETKASKFILKCTNFRDKRGGYGFAEITISEAPVLDKYIEKQLGKMHSTPKPEWDTYIFGKQEALKDKSLIVNPDEVIDLRDNLDENGVLNWEAPEGNWTIMRMGMTPTGTKNAPAAPQGVGYEIDKMNSGLAQYHFDNFVGEFLKRIPEESKSAFKYVVADSYEQGSQNWTDGYEIKFKEKYGYDPVPFLPVLSGRIVGSVEQSERFLWDLRRSIADDVAYEYVGGLRKASNKHNLKTWLENYGHWGFPGEFMMYGGQSDLIAGEFWNEGTLGNIECKASSSTAHTYGKPITSAEAFTSSRRAYLRHPAMLKKRGDWALTEGINHFVLHLYIQQPDDNRKPGMNAWFGTEFNRHNTWFSQADTYFDYLRRCQHLLQQGKYVADVCYFIGEDAPIMTGGRIPEIPKGYSYDYINAEVILDRLTVKDGRFVLPDGMSYKVMVLPPFKTMRPELLAKLEQLVAQGGTILGQKPEKSPSLTNYPKSDDTVKDLANKMWNANYVDGKMKATYGKGKIWDGYQLSEVFTELNLAKDLDVPEDTPVLWIHRNMPGMDVYFISNQSDKELNIAPVFRTDKSLKPQLWNALTGEIRDLPEYEMTETGIKVPLQFEGAQSWFIVFSKEAKTDKASNFPEYKPLVTLNKDFKVNFQNKEIGPKETLEFNELQDWSTSDNEQIKFYSGTATYTKTFTIDTLPKNQEMYINLGKVSVMAKVKLNGKYLGGVWMAPHRLNISEAIKTGENKLEIEIVNLWRNQLIRDKSRAEDEKYTWIVIDKITPESPLQKSGLLGPVVIEAAEY